MPDIKETFYVKTPILIVWSFFQDVPQVADCMPGVELLDDLGNGTFKGKMKVKIGPINAEFQGEARIMNLDESTRTGLISAQGVDRQGGSRALAKVGYSLSSVDSGTNVEINADIALQGSMAQFGRTGLIQEVSSQLTKEFARCVEHRLSITTIEEAMQARAPEVRAVRLLLRTLWTRLRRILLRRSA